MTGEWGHKLGAAKGEMLKLPRDSWPEIRDPLIDKAKTFEATL